jgi:glutamyl-tRNA synthetase
MSEANCAVGRLAPSPTGAQHLGNARTFLLAWLAIRSRKGRVILRMEDIDSPRVKTGADQQAIDDLRWLGLDWEEGPDLGGTHAPYIQTHRYPFYRNALNVLKAQERVYPCTCSRADVAQAASAPHIGQEGPVYPGTCASKKVADAQSLSGQPYVWRLRTTDTLRTLVDQVAGPRSCNVSQELGDFVLAKADETPAYQLAVVVDDQAMGVTDVLRGDDLLPSAFRQLELYEAFGWNPPSFAHVPLVVGADGRRLAKRHGDTRLATLRTLGVDPQRLVGWLAWTCGLVRQPVSITPRELVPSFRLDAVPGSQLVVTDEEVRSLHTEI